MGRIVIRLTLAITVGCAAPSPAATTPTVAPPAREAAPAPEGAVDLPSVIGVWRGTSLCTVHPSPCNDETVVYYLSGSDRDHIASVGNKIVDGKEEEMGRLECQLLPVEHRLVCKIERGAFVYAIDGNRMHGRLDLPDGTRYRVIEVERVR